MPFLMLDETRLEAQYQRLNQRPVQPSFGQPIFNLDVEKCHQIPQNCIVGGPRTPHLAKQQVYLDSFYHPMAFFCMA